MNIETNLLTSDQLRHSAYQIDGIDRFGHEFGASCPSASWISSEGVPAVNVMTGNK